MIRASTLRLSAVKQQENSALTTHWDTLTSGWCQCAVRSGASGSIGPSLLLQSPSRNGRACVWRGLPLFCRRPTSHCTTYFHNSMSVSHGVCPTVWGYVRVPRCLYDGLRVCPCPMVSGCVSHGLSVPHCASARKNMAGLSFSKKKCFEVRFERVQWRIPSEQVYCFGKRNVLRLDLNESSEGFLQSRSIVLEKEMFWG